MAAMELLLIELCRMLGGGAGGGKEKIGETERSQLIKNVITYIKIQQIVADPIPPPVLTGRDAIAFF